MEKLLPTHYFLLTITLPQELRGLARSHQKTIYSAMFSCANDALKKLARDKRFIGSTRIGYLAVLHTCGSALQYHPHIHLVIPGGAVSEEGDQWISSRQDLFVHTKPLAVIFKAKFRDAMKKAQLLDEINPDVWKQEWVIDTQAVGKGENSLRSTRFMKIRHYGFLNPNSSFSIEKIRELICLIHDVIRDLLPKVPEYKKERIKCNRCGNLLRFIAFLKPIPGWGPFY